MHTMRWAVWTNPTGDKWYRAAFYLSQATARMVADAIIVRGTLALVLPGNATPDSVPTVGAHIADRGEPGDVWVRPECPPTSAVTTPDRKCWHVTLVTTLLTSEGN